MLLAKGTGSAQLPLTVSFLYFLRTQSAVVRLRKVSMGATLVSWPLQMVNFLLSYFPARTFSILSMMADARGVLVTLASSPAQSRTNMQFWTYFIQRRSFWVNWAGMDRPKLRSQTMTSQSSINPPILASATDRPNIFCIFQAKMAYSSSIKAVSFAMSSNLLAMRLAWLGQEGKQAVSCLIGTGWYPLVNANSSRRGRKISSSSLREADASTSKGGCRRALGIPSGTFLPCPT